MLRYKEEHVIGLTILQKHMAQALNRDLDMIVPKTLQRFLLGTHKTNEAFLALCSDFAAGLPGPTLPDDLAGAFAEFFDLSDMTNAGGPPVQDRAGRKFDIFNLNLTAERYKRLTVISQGDDPSAVYFGRLSVGHATSGGPHVVQEEVLNPYLVQPYDPLKVPMRRLYEGIACWFGERALLMLRNKSTRAPRFGWLRPATTAGQYVYNTVEPAFESAEDWMQTGGMRCRPIVTQGAPA